MMEATQHITASKVVFEVTSAIGTVGLSMGATASLDQIGKLIIMVAMFAGRIGPMTLFMLLGEDRSSSAPRYPEAKISLT
jgi:trk system potassium uptake protein TrkH